MTTRDPACDDARSSDATEFDTVERERAVESLTEALEAEESDEKDYRIREALQLLALKDE